VRFLALCLSLFVPPFFNRVSPAAPFFIHTTLQKWKKQIILWISPHFYPRLGLLAPPLQNPQGLSYYSYSQYMRKATFIPPLLPLLLTNSLFFPRKRKKSSLTLSPSGLFYLLVLSLSHPSEFVVPDSLWGFQHIFLSPPPSLPLILTLGTPYLSRPLQF